MYRGNIKIKLSELKMELPSIIYLHKNKLNDIRIVSISSQWNKCQQ